MKERISNFFSGVILPSRYFIAGFILALGLVIVAYGFLPNMAPISLPSTLMSYGKLDCVADNPSFVLNFHCPVVGGDSGAVTVMGSPIPILGLPFMRLGLGTQWTYFIVASIFVTTALVGVYKLLRRLEINRSLALFFGTLYMLTPLMMSMQSFGGTFWGILLLPTYIYFVSVFLDKTRSSNLKGKLSILLAWTALCVFQLFMDGYSFTMATAASASLVLIWGWGKWKLGETWWGVGLFATSLFLAYMLYTSVIPGSDGWESSLGFFRAMSLDPYTTLLPSRTLWWVDIFNVAENRQAFWGDETNSAHNYVGVSLVLLALYGLYWHAKKRINKEKQKNTGQFSTRALLASLLLTSIGAFILSLGPSLKWNSTLPNTPNDHMEQVISYRMPADQAVANLPTQKIFTNLPGIKSMRAIYRWHALTMLVAIVFAALGVQRLHDKRLRWLYLPLVFIVAAELAPNFPALIRHHLSNDRKVTDVNLHVIDPLKGELTKHEKVVFYPASTGGNDYLVNFIAPTLDIRTYNVGGDKALALAKTERPEPISELLELADEERSQKDVELIGRVLHETDATAIIVPHFDLRWDSYTWNRGAFVGEARAKNLLKRIEGNQHFSVENFEVVSVIRLKK